MGARGAGVGSDHGAATIAGGPRAGPATPPLREHLRGHVGACLLSSKVTGRTGPGAGVASRSRAQRPPSKPTPPAVPCRPMENLFGVEIVIYILKKKSRKTTLLAAITIPASRCGRGRRWSRQRPRGGYRCPRPPRRTWTRPDPRPRPESTRVDSGTRLDLDLHGASLRSKRTLPWIPRVIVCPGQPEAPPQSTLSLFSLQYNLPTIQGGVFLLECY